MQHIDSGKKDQILFPEYVTAEISERKLQQKQRLQTVRMQQPELSHQHLESFTPAATVDQYNLQQFHQKLHSIDTGRQLELFQKTCPVLPLDLNGDESDSDDKRKKPKVKRRRIATLAQRRAANVRERKRMLNLNDAFDVLRKKVPTFAYEKKLSRIETLRLALMYISYMTDIISNNKTADTASLESTIVLHNYRLLHPTQVVQTPKFAMSNISDNFMNTNNNELHLTTIHANQNTDQYMNNSNNENDNGNRSYLSNENLLKLEKTNFIKQLTDMNGVNIPNELLPQFADIPPEYHSHLMLQLSQTFHNNNNRYLPPLPPSNDIGQQFIDDACFANLQMIQDNCSRYPPFIPPNDMLVQDKQNEPPTNKSEKEFQNNSELPSINTLNVHSLDSSLVTQYSHGDKMTGEYF
ncbi:hypothetical protein SNEBB_007634 [Seison nebaliae]|nr:hypothetical protein SNEBB_007634 [Seison nebaliae]